MFERATFLASPVHISCVWRMIHLYTFWEPLIRVTYSQHIYLFDHYKLQLYKSRFNIYLTYRTSHSAHSSDSCVFTVSTFNNTPCLIILFLILKWTLFKIKIFFKSESIIVKCFSVYHYKIFLDKVKGFDMIVILISFLYLSTLLIYLFLLFIPYFLFRLWIRRSWIHSNIQHCPRQHFRNSACAVRQY